MINTQEVYHSLVFHDREKSNHESSELKSGRQTVWYIVGSLSPKGPVNSHQ